MDVRCRLVKVNKNKTSPSRTDEFICLESWQTVKYKPFWVYLFDVYLQELDYVVEKMCLRKLGI